MSTTKKSKDSLDMGNGSETTVLSPEQSVERAAEAFGIPLADAKKASNA